MHISVDRSFTVEDQNGAHVTIESYPLSLPYNRIVMVLCLLYLKVTSFMHIDASMVVLDNMTSHMVSEYDLKSPQYLVMCPPVHNNANITMICGNVTMC